ncbi:MAG: lysostaphin resistance A-like protein [Anaerotruncus massiliensis (ex Togo et al. 2019)]
MLGLSVIGSPFAGRVDFLLLRLLPADLPMESPATRPPPLYIFNATALPALIEEFTYRGVVLGSCAFGDRFAIVVSALLFGLLHRNMVQFPTPSCWARRSYFMVQTNSIWTSMAIHFSTISGRPAFDRHRQHERLGTLALQGLEFRLLGRRRARLLVSLSEARAGQFPAPLRLPAAGADPLPQVFVNFRCSCCWRSTCGFST